MGSAIAKKGIMGESNPCWGPRFSQRGRRKGTGDPGNSLPTCLTKLDLEIEVAGQNHDSLFGRTRIRTFEQQFHQS